MGNNKKSSRSSRGRSNYDEEIISVAPYKEPQLTLTAHRCDANGTANDAGEYKAH